MALNNNDPLRIIPTKHAPESKADIGSGLRAARLKKGHSLEAVTQHTRISKKFLEALENNRFDEFPALAYLRGFLKTYCDYLELDFEPLWRQLIAEPAAEDAGPAAAPAPAAPAVPAAAKPAVPAAPKPAAPKGQAKPAAPRPGSHPPPAARGAASETPGAGAALLSALLIVVGALWLTLGRGSESPKGELSQPTPPAVLQPIQGPVEPSLLIELRGESWLSVTVDGALKFEGRAPRNSRQEWKAKSAILLRASDPAALQLTLNGQPFRLGAPDAAGAYRIEAR